MQFRKIGLVLLLILIIGIFSGCGPEKPLHFDHSGMSEKYKIITIPNLLLLIIGFIGGSLFMLIKYRHSTMFKVSIVILILGFFIAWKIKIPDASTPVFWLGFFWFLSSRHLANRENPLWQGAILGLLAHPLLYVISVYLDLDLKYIYRPITYFAHSFPPPQHIHTDIKLILETIYIFLNIQIFILIGAILGKLYLKKGILLPPKK